MVPVFLQHISSFHIRATSFLIEQKLGWNSKLGRFLYMGVSWRGEAGLKKNMSLSSRGQACRTWGHVTAKATQKGAGGGVWPSILVSPLSHSLGEEKNNLSILSPIYLGLSYSFNKSRVLWCSWSRLMHAAKKRRKEKKKTTIWALHILKLQASPALHRRLCTSWE